MSSTNGLNVLNSFSIFGISFLLDGHKYNFDFTYDVVNKEFIYECFSETIKDEYGNFWNSDYFEPRDEVKGDIARAVLYLVVRYDGDVCSKCSLDLELVEGDSDKYTNVLGKEGYLGDIITLIKWHYEDPVSEDEMARNEVICKYQGNRNPFIDHPEFVYGLYEEYAKNYITE